ncbi:MAG: tetratricopeptide repeat protein [Syntrophales bacterium]
MSQKIPNYRRQFLICLILTVTVLAVFWQVKNNDFVNFDDPRCTTENLHIQSGLNLGLLKWAFTTSHAGYWQPLTWLSFAMDYQLFGLHAGGYHIVNLLFHTVNSLLLFLILSRMTHALWKSAFVAALFALHPIHVESVAWIAERKDVLSAFFWMLTMGSYVFYVEKPGVKKYLLTLFFFALGLMAKPMLVTLPFVLLLLDYWPLGRIRFNHSSDVPKISESKKEKKRARKISSQAKGKELSPSDQSLLWQRLWPVFREKVPFFALSAISSIVTAIGQQEVGAMESLEILPIGARIGNALISYMRYIGMTIYPHGLAVFYPHAGTPPLWEVLLTAAFVLIATLVIIRWAAKMPYLAMGWLWYLGTLVPVIGIIQVGMQSMADRYTYIPVIGLFVATAWAVPDIARNWRYRQYILTAGALIVFSALMFSTWMQVKYWQNSITLFEHAIQVTDNNYLAHNNLGVALSDAGKKEEAMAHYREAIRIKPSYENAYFNLGNNLSAQGRTDDAVLYYQEALRLRPNYAKAHNNLARLLISKNMFKEAIGHFQEALKTEPTNAGMHYNLGIAWMSIDHFEDAIGQFQEAVRINPRFIEAHNAWGIALARLGKTDEAIDHFRASLRIKPNFRAADDNLKAALAQQKMRR